MVGSHYRAHVNLFSIGQSKRKLIAVDAQLHGISHGGELDERHAHPRYDAHIQEVLTK